MVIASKPTPESSPPRVKPQGSIVAKLTLFVGFLVALTAGVLITVGYLYVSAMVSSQIDAQLSVIADDRQALLLTTMQQEEERVRQLATRTRLRILLEQLKRGSLSEAQFGKDVEDVLDDVRESAKDFLAIWLEDVQGKVLASSGPAEITEKFPIGRWSAREPSRGETLVAVPEQVGTTPTALFSAPVRDRARSEIGRILLLVDLGRIAAELSNSEWLGRTGEVLLGIHEDGGIRYLFPPRHSPERTRFPIDKSASMNLAIMGRRGLLRSPDRLGRDVLAAYRPVGYGGWGMVAKIDVAEAYAPVTRLRWLLMAIGGSILTFGLAASYVLARQHTRPIRRLAEAAEAVASGDLNAPIHVSSNDEIGVLGLAFSKMTEQLALSHADLELRISERTRDLEAVRDLLDAFFRISTSQADSQTIDRTFDSVLQFCSRLGYDLAMISLVDREAGVIRGVRGAGSMTGVVEQTVRPLDGRDVLADVVREGRIEIIPDSLADPRCDHEAVAQAGIRGQIILPLVGEDVLGTLQVAVRGVLDPAAIDLRPLETLASHAARTLSRLNQVEEIRRLNQRLGRHAGELARSEAALREQTGILRSVLDCMSEGVVVADKQARLLVINPAAERIFGRRPVAEAWHPLASVYPPNVGIPYKTAELPLHRSIGGESVDQIELMIGHPSLQQGRCMLVNGRPLVDDRGAIQGGLVVFHDITRRKRFEQRLAVEYATARVLAEADSLVEAAPRILQIVGERLEWDFGILWRTDSGSQQIRCLTVWRTGDDASSSFEEQLRAHDFRSGEALPGRVWANCDAVWIPDLSQDPDRRLADTLAAEGLRTAFGTPVLLRGECLGVLGFFSRQSRSQDSELIAMMKILGNQIGQFIDRTQMHARVVQSEKLASLGMLSASVAHEINNPLAYVANNLASLDRDARALMGILVCYEQSIDLIASARPDLAIEIRRLDEECDLAYVKEHLGKMLGSTRQGVKRVADIVHNLRGFARFDRKAADQVDLHETIDAALEMIRGRLDRRGIAVSQRWGTVPLVAASPAQLNQVFLNLLVNAMQAIDSTHRQDGEIVIETKLRDDDVCVAIRDNGCGMPVDVQSQIFDPFFTTKASGEGTGLGLSISHGIVLDHGGRIEVESATGEGTCFRVVLPISRKSDS
ncbi:HAMP domain-containing histidine kinase [Paludisphaera borealis]|uniref:histidine kinase n=1 Tax=Paludisphaera borealis TaxID=1387353 RepID=A0A1U7CJA4_9BACT|nr:HAMP domain-containing histidine kinase [Paludisphaera borealis]APW58986.1 Sensor protein ZraS [Paludisphaera borealis]